MLLLFWGVFLPLGERWSVDALQSSSVPRRAVASLGSAVLLLQIVLMYVVNGLHKAESELWRSGEATVLIFGLDDMTYLLADVLRQVPALLEIGGRAWYYLTLLSPALLILVGRPRAAVAAAFVIGHLSFAATVRIGSLPYAAIAGLVLFVQSPVWADVTTAVTSLPKSVEETRRRAIAAGESLADHLPRYRIARRPDRPVLQHSGRAVIVVVLLLAGSTMTVSTLQSADLVHEDHDLPYGEHVDIATEVLRVDQPSWRVFAPKPQTTDYYYVFPAETTDGTRLDVYNDRPLSYDRPYLALQRQYPTYRHRFFMNEVRRSAEDGEEPAVDRSVAQYLCENWSDDEARLQSVEIAVVRESVTRSTIDTPFERQRSIAILSKYDCELLER